MHGMLASCDYQYITERQCTFSTPLMTFSAAVCNVDGMYGPLRGQTVGAFGDQGQSQSIRDCPRCLGKLGDYESGYYFPLKWRLL